MVWFAQLEHTTKHLKTVSKSKLTFFLAPENSEPAQKSTGAMLQKANSELRQLQHINDVGTNLEICLSNA